MGSIGQLIEDDSLALRLVFDDEIPTLANRYLRAFTLTDFDGRFGQTKDRLSAVAAHAQGRVICSGV